MIVTRTETITTSYTVNADNMKEAIKKISSGNAVKGKSIIVEMFYQMEEE